MRLTAVAHAIVADVLQTGACALDATAGNGHDTLHLARCVGIDGHVWSIDCQPCALRAARQRLLDASPELADRVTFLLGNHARLGRMVPVSALRAVMFNLGYLPGGDRTITTRAQDTLRALAAAAATIEHQGILTVMAYPGHAQGEIELAALIDWIACGGAGLGWQRVDPLGGPGAGPSLFLGQHRADDAARRWGTSIQG